MGAELLEFELEKLNLLLQNKTISQIKYTTILNKLENCSLKNAAIKTINNKLTTQIVSILTSGHFNNNNEGLSMVGINWLIQLLNQQKITNLDNEQFEKLYKWLNIFMNRKNTNGLTAADNIVLSALIALFKSQPQYADNYCNLLIGNADNGPLIRYLLISSENKNEELLSLTVQCLDAILSAALNPESQIAADKLEIYENVANKLLHLHYNYRSHDGISFNTCCYIINSLNLLNKLCGVLTSFSTSKMSELFGLSKAYINYGIDKNAIAINILPQKVNTTPQPNYDSTDENARDIGVDGPTHRGGKITKTRKARAFSKTAAKQLDAVEDERDLLGRNFANECKISDSDTSDNETSTNRLAHERYRYGKIRLLSITLIGIVAHAQERRILYGYWHAFFPSTLIATTRNDLLRVSQIDPSARCRIAAMQVATQLLYGSKNFLSQAEYDNKRCPTTFIPFSMALGEMVLSIYDALINILSIESSLPVLRQTLKCLAVLVQATPFQRLEGGGNKFITRFIEQVRPLVYHRDHTMQVSALMVLEYLLSSTEWIQEIVEAIGLPKAELKLNHYAHQQIDEAEELVEIPDTEEYVESDEEINEIKNITTELSTVQIKCQQSWLLFRLFQNLKNNANERSKIPATIRIESLQVLSVMATHFALFATYLPNIGKVLQLGICDTTTDVALNAARCLDTCAYQISRHLMRNTNVNLQDYDKFWMELLPIIMEQIRRAKMTTFKVCLCDALSNIGVIVYEHLPQVVQMSLLSFLSGLSSDSMEEMIVRSAAVRALAVYVLFPSLQCNMVFVENVADLTLRIINDGNTMVRIKAFWAMGNVSDALIMNAISNKQERITNNILKSMIKAATEACSDNDKVRCNAVRTLGNLLRLITEIQFDESDCRIILKKAVHKLIDCIRSSGNAKVKWNSCYAIGNLVRNDALFEATIRYNDLDWQPSLYHALCHIIVNHANFKVRINATTAITHIAERRYFGCHFEIFWLAILTAIEQSHNLDNFYEYNHRDNLQEQLCLAVAHFLKLATIDDVIILKKNLLDHLELIKNTWLRVTHRMLPEKAAPLLSCSVLFVEKFRDKISLTHEQQNAISFIVKTFNVNE